MVAPTPQQAKPNTPKKSCCRGSGRYYEMLTVEHLQRCGDITANNEHQIQIKQLDFHVSNYQS